jgi:alpha-L-fucosidase 2
MLLQSHAGEINLLPALPSKYPNGFVKGLRARGACAIDIDWKDGKLLKAQIKSDKGGTFIIRYKTLTRNITLKPDQIFGCNEKLEPVN